MEEIHSQINILEYEAGTINMQGEARNIITESFGSTIAFLCDIIKKVTASRKVSIDAEECLAIR